MKNRPSLSDSKARDKAAKKAQKKTAKVLITQPTTQTPKKSKVYH